MRKAQSFQVSAGNLQDKVKVLHFWVEDLASELPQAPQKIIEIQDLTGPAWMDLELAAELHDSDPEVATLRFNLAKERLIKATELHRNILTEVLEARNEQRRKALDLARRSKFNPIREKVRLMMKKERILNTSFKTFLINWLNAPSLGLEIEELHPSKLGGEPSYLMVDVTCESKIIKHYEWKLGLGALRGEYSKSSQHSSSQPASAILNDQHAA